MKKARKPKLVIRTFTSTTTGSRRPNDNEPITTSGTVCTWIAQR